MDFFSHWTKGSDLMAIEKIGNRVYILLGGYRKKTTSPFYISICILDHTPKPFLFLIVWIRCNIQTYYYCIGQQKNKVFFALALVLVRAMYLYYLVVIITHHVRHCSVNGKGK